MITKKLFSPSLGLTIHRLTISSSHARRIRSGVAGENSSRTSSTPASLRAELIASRMAKKTEEPMNNGGSPTLKSVSVRFEDWGEGEGGKVPPRDRWMVRRFFHSTFLRKLTRKSCGISLLLVPAKQWIDTMQMEFCRRLDRG